MFLNYDPELKPKAELMGGKAPTHIPNVNTKGNCHHIQQPHQPLTSTSVLTPLNKTQSESTRHVAREIQQESTAAPLEEHRDVRPAKRQHLNGKNPPQRPVPNTIDASEAITQPPVPLPGASGPNYRALLPTNPVHTANCHHATLSTLPSFLQYVDNRIMRTFEKHNHPPTTTEQCICCGWQHDLSPIASAFVPLVCGHWLHYRCLVWNACQLHDNRDGCPTCYTKIFEWDGMNVLTVATRTGLEIQNHKWAVGKRYWNSNVKRMVASDKEEYEIECLAIEKCIAGTYCSMAPQSMYRDGSQDVVKMYHDTLAALHEMGKPQSKWLRWRTYTGYLLFAILVAQKLKRWLAEVQPGILQMEGGREFEEGMRGLQGRLLAEVRELDR